MLKPCPTISAAACRTLFGTRRWSESKIGRLVTRAPHVPQVTHSANSGAVQTRTAPSTEPSRSDKFAKRPVVQIEKVDQNQTSNQNRTSKEGGITPAHCQL